MAIDKSIITPADATAAVQAGFDYANGLLPFSAVFPMRSNEGNQTVSWTPNLRDAAVNPMQRRALDAEVGHIKRETVSQEKHARLLPLAGMDHITEQDMTDHGNDSTWLRTRAEDGFTFMGRMAAVTLEIERLNALVTGKIVINTDGNNVEYTFGRPNGQQSQAPTTKWNEANSDPASDIDAWNKKIRKGNGRIPRAAFTTTAVIDALRTNDIIRQWVYQTSADLAPARVTRNEVLSYFYQNTPLSEIRMIDDLYESLELDNNFTMNVDTASLIPDKTFVMFPSFNDSTVGFTADGPTAEAGDSEYGLNKQVNQGMIGALLRHESPVNYDLWVNGTALPVLVDAASTFEADVL